MSAGSTRDRHVSGRRQNDESEPFLVQQIPGSPVQRGRRRDDEEEQRFPVQRIPGSPVQRGRRRHDEEERFPVQRIPGSPVQRGRRRHDEEERFLVDDMTGSPIARGRVPRVTPATTTTIGDAVDGSAPSPSAPPPTDYVDTIGRSPLPPDNDDAPPSYESSIPPSQFGWAAEIVAGPTMPFPMPFSNVADDGRSVNVFSYPSQDAYPPIGLSPMAKSYQSLDTSKSRSPMRSTSPSLCPSPDRCRPAYTYQQLRVATPPPRPRFGIDSDSDRSVVKPQNDFSYKYGAIVIAIVFVVFLMLLSLAVKFFIRNSFRQ